jgi:predicted SAM-dependent methyltransferase
MQDVNYDLVGPIDEGIPLKDNSVDGILSSSVLEDLRYPEKFFSKPLVFWFQVAPYSLSSFLYS